MNREIKFRAWDADGADGEKMVSPDLIDRDGIGWWTSNSITTCSKVLMQYTGLKDKNGKEVYEGDILRDSEASYQVVWKNELSAFTLIRLETGDDMRGFGCYDFSVVSDFILQSRVVTNIYESPELLNP